MEQQTLRVARVFLAGAAVLAVMSLSSIPARAHHGWGGYEDKTTDITGTVESPVNVSGPHATMKIKVDGQLVDAYYFCVGGAVGEYQVFARPVGYRCAAGEVPEAIERLLRVYQAERRPDENLRSFFARHSDDQLRNFLAGAEVVGVARDPSPGRPPHGVEG